MTYFNISKNKHSYIASVGITFLLGICLFLSGCCCKVNKEDPLEKYNRVMHRINKTVDTLFILPVTRTYVAVIPKPLRCIVNNFYRNLRTIPTVLNDLLQADSQAFYNDSARLILNTTLGIGGLFDVAAKANLEYKYRDFGLTLARWGHRESTYVVLPFFGPSTLRDAIGLGVTYYMTIWPYLPRMVHVHHHKAIGLRNALLIGDVIDLRAELLDLEKVLDAAAIDEYVLVRDAYMQNRRYQISGEKAVEASDSESTLQGPPE